jgi:hypothetical protein
VNFVLPVDETGDSAATEPPRGWSRVVSQKTMIEVAPDVEIPSAGGGGWSCAFARVVCAKSRSRFADRAIAATPTVLRNAVSKLDASSCVKLDRVTRRRTSVGATMPIDSSGIEIVVVNRTS